MFPVAEAFIKLVIKAGFASPIFLDITAPVEFNSNRALLTEELFLTDPVPMAPPASIKALMDPLTNQFCRCAVVPVIPFTVIGIPAISSLFTVISV